MSVEFFTSWRLGLTSLDLLAFHLLPHYIMTIPVLNLWLLPKISNDSGMGWLMAQADKQVADREENYERNLPRSSRLHATVGIFPSEGKVEFLIIIDSCLRPE